jgi:hypothetical protein
MDRGRALRRRKAEIDNRLARLREDRLIRMATQSASSPEPTTDLERRVARAHQALTRATESYQRASESYQRSTRARQWAAAARDRAADMLEDG